MRGQIWMDSLPKIHQSKKVEVDVNPKDSTSTKPSATQVKSVASPEGQTTTTPTLILQDN